MGTACKQGFEGAGHARHELDHPWEPRASKASKVLAAPLMHELDHPWEPRAVLGAVLLLLLANQPTVKPT